MERLVVTINQKMIEIKELSRIGLGTYRMNHDYVDALKYALDQGYNLIDTATNYKGGESEKMIGSFLENHSNYRSQMFIISKVGYIPADYKKSDELKEFLSSVPIEKSSIQTDFDYSIDPEFIDFQLNRSLSRMNLQQIDVYLLHNPERILSSQILTTKEELYTRIYKAFVKLEQLVEIGKIRYYGISSNICFHQEGENSIDIEKILALAASINQDHHFKFIQFPFNFMEQMAVEKTYNGKSLIEFAKLNKLITVGNRPLNMNDDDHEFRFVDYSASYNHLNESLSDQSFNDFQDMVEERLTQATGQAVKLIDFEPTKILSLARKKFQSVSGVNDFFRIQLYPFLSTFCEDTQDPIYNKATYISHDMKLFAMRNMTLKSKKLMATLSSEGVEKKKNYPLTAAHYYLGPTGLDHVLMGMRRKEYIDDLNGEFGSPK